MKGRLVFIIVACVAFAAIAIPAYAQSPTQIPTADPQPTGEVTGIITNQSPGGSIPESATVMLHVLDENYSQLGMLHSESQSDGTFLFEDVPLSAGMFYVGFVTYGGASYTSQPIPYDGKTTPNIEVPIYDFTNEVSDVYVDEMHVLFNFAEDGLEVNEIYLITNMGDRTVTGTLTLTDGMPATLQFPIQEGADYVFFKPDDDSERFVKVENSFVDKSPLVPGERTGQMMVSYLVPYAEKMTYTYKAPITVQNIDFLLPAESGILLMGQNLLGPEITTLQDDSVYQVYTYKNLNAGQTASLDFVGSPNLQANDADSNVTNQSKFPTNWVIGIGGGVFGVLMIAFGVWQWQKSKADDTDDDIEDEADENDLQVVIARIAQLDGSREQGEIDEAGYREQRAALREKARALLDKTEK